MKRILMALFVGLVFIQPLYVQAAQLMDGIVAIVGSHIILVSELKAREDMYRSGRFGQNKHMTRSEVLDEIIEEKLLRLELKNLDIELTQQDKDHAVRMVLAQNQITLPVLKRELASKGIPWEVYENDLYDRIRMMKFMRNNIHSKVNVTKADIDVYRRRNPKKVKQQSEDEIRNSILETKSRDYLKSYLSDVRSRTFVEIKDIQ